MSLHECPSHEALSRYAIGDLPPNDANTIDIHVGRCTVCLSRLNELAARPDPLLAALRMPVGPATDKNPALAHAMAAVLAGWTSLPTGDSSALAPGTVVNGYRIVEEIGRGGMGHVYRAVHPRLDQEVALKILRPGIESADASLERFRAELQALTRMDHPYVARVLDGGATEDGRPYFVMELVRGVALTRYCDEHRLTVNERLGVFINICHAVQHAHQKGIIHRDLKPSNVLVAEYGGKPAPKVIDFGIAKALDRSAGHTEVGIIIGTLDYMSPEQADARAADIDTRSDVYSLGVLLHELLTGETPLGGRMRETPVLELLRLLSEGQPAPPSTRLSTSPVLREIAASRGTEPARLVKQVRGELDWLVLKALDKDRTRRHQTAVALAEDVQRFLNHEPVSAGPPGRIYRFRKFAQRHRGVVIAASLLTLTLVGGIIGTSLGLIRATEEKGIAQSERDKKNSALIDLEMQQRKTQAALTAETHARKQAMFALRSLTDDVVERQMAQRQQLTDDDRRFLRDIQRQYEAFAALPGEDAEQCATRAEGHQRIGLIRARLGDEKEAEAAYRKALDLYQTLVAAAPGNGDFGRDLAMTHHYLGILLRDQGRYTEAEAAHVAALHIRQKLAADFPARAEFRQELAAGQNSLGVLLFKASRFKDAENAFAGSIAALKQLTDEFPDQPNYRQSLAQSHVSLAALYRTIGRKKDAETAYGNALADLADLPNVQHELATIHHNLGNLRRAARSWKDAEQSYGEALKIRKQSAAAYAILPDLRNEYANTLNSLGLLYRDTNRPREAEAAYAEARAIRAQLVKDFAGRLEFRIDLAAVCNNLGVLYRDLGRHHEAEAALNQALPLRRQTVSEFPGNSDHRNKLAGTLVNLANVHNDRREFAVARWLLDEAAAHHRAALKAQPRQPLYREFYRNNLTALVRSCAGIGDRAAASKAALKLRDLGWDPPRHAYDAARALASCLPIIEKQDRVSAPERRQAMNGYADEAMTMLREAVSLGHTDVARLAKDSAFNPLRQRADFKQLLADLAQR